MCISNNSMAGFVRTWKDMYHKIGLNHVLLYLLYIAYLLLGATVFYALEHDSSDHFRQKWKETMAMRRANFIEKDILPEIFNNSRYLVFIHNRKTQYFTSIMKMKLQTYENRLDVRPRAPYLKWTFANSLFYCWTTITTIGYGHIYPVSSKGRVLSVAYAIFGVPFTIIVIKDLAYLIAKLLNYPSIVLAYVWHLFRYCTLQPVTDRELYQSIEGSRWPNDADFRVGLIRRMLNIPAFVAIFALFGWLAVGAFAMAAYEKEFSPFLAFYFLFNTLATIGIGDLQPTNPNVLLVLCIYVYIGLAIVSLFINLLHAKFSRAYWMPNPILLQNRTGTATRQQQQDGTEAMPKVASFDSEMSLSDVDLNHYVTLGVLQAEDRRPLIAGLLKDRGYRHAQTQTIVTLPEHKVRLIETGRKDAGAPSAVYLQQPSGRTSRDDVHNLITETYSVRPPRLI